MTMTYGSMDETGGRLRKQIVGSVGTLELLANPEHGQLGDLIDVDRYPIDRPGCSALLGVIDHVRTQLAADGLAVLPGFLTGAALDKAAAEVVATEQHVPIRTHKATVYHRPDLTADALADDPRSVELEWRAGHITRDMIPPFWCAHRLYVSALFKQFIAACVGEVRVFEYADPLAGLVATILPPGGQYPWHYDTNEFVVTIMTQQPEGGGAFEYRKDLRTPGDENLDGLSRVLHGEDDSVRRIMTAPGDLQLFLGRYSLHQVTEVTGDVTRHVMVFSYADRPGVIGPVDRTRSVYGRVTEAHLVAEQRALESADGLIL